ncbi:hypothetical protein CALVIDRAFT_57269 [Calocera viscosa TUFC12733]|uniref:Uncharacterized protein n=1 Tax=Calocera viscosa (strain TUFC12733) TaxID=1330018 RepID=A0A167FHV1_CALVF|nr:hypothetical protein CALVIDRAFT_57269 [Calocera viscosa TUFC12733]
MSRQLRIIGYEALCTARYAISGTGGRLCTGRRARRPGQRSGSLACAIGSFAPCIYPGLRPARSRTQRCWQVVSLARRRALQYRLRRALQLPVSHLGAAGEEACAPGTRVYVRSRAGRSAALLLMGREVRRGPNTCDVRPCALPSHPPPPTLQIMSNDKCVLLNLGGVRQVRAMKLVDGVACAGGGVGGPVGAGPACTEGAEQGRLSWRRADERRSCSTG